MVKEECKSGDSCATNLIGLEGSPKKWRAEATVVMIEHDQHFSDLKKDLSWLKKEFATGIALIMIVLSVLIKLALG